MPQVPCTETAPTASSIPNLSRSFADIGPMRPPTNASTKVNPG